MPRTALIASGNAAHRLLLGIELLTEGYRSVLSPDTTQLLLDLARDPTIDVVIADADNLNALASAVARIRASRARLPIILITRSSHDPPTLDGDRVARVGPDNVLPELRRAVHGLRPPFGLPMLGG